MKQEYLKQVDRLLLLPRRQRREILRDLEESFDSAREHGETEETVIARLGTPEEFAAAMLEQLGETPKAPSKGPFLLWMGVGAFFFLLALIVRGQRFPADAIGGAISLTGITIMGSFSLNVPQLLLLLGLLALTVALVLGIRLLRMHRR